MRIKMLEKHQKRKSRDEMDVCDKKKCKRKKLFVLFLKTLYYYIFFRQVVKIYSKTGEKFVG